MAAVAFLGAALACTPRVNDVFLGTLVLGFTCGGIVGVLMRGAAGALLGASVGLTLATLAVAVLFLFTGIILFAIVVDARGESPRDWARGDAIAAVLSAPKDLCGQHQPDAQVLKLRYLALADPIRLARMVKEVNRFDETVTHTPPFRPHGRREAAAMRPKGKTAKGLVG